MWPGGRGQQSGLSHCRAKGKRLILDEMVSHAGVGRSPKMREIGVDLSVRCCATSLMFRAFVLSWTATLWLDPAVWSALNNKAPLIDRKTSHWMKNPVQNVNQTCSRLKISWVFFVFFNITSQPFCQTGFLCSMRVEDGWILTKGHGVTGSFRSFRDAASLLFLHIGGWAEQQPELRLSCEGTGSTQRRDTLQTSVTSVKEEPCRWRKKPKL